MDNIEENKITFCNFRGLIPATFKNRGDDFIVCNIEVFPPTYESYLKEINGVLKAGRWKVTHEIEDCILRIDTSDSQILEKIERLKSNQQIHIFIEIPKGTNYMDLKHWGILGLYDDIDMIERSNKYALFSAQVPKRENNSKKKRTYKKDLEIAKLQKQILELKQQLKQYQEKDNK